MDKEKEPTVMEEPAQISLELLTEIPPVENLKGVVVMSGKENFLQVEIRTLFGIWKGYWLLKSDGNEKKEDEAGDKPS